MANLDRSHSSWVSNFSYEDHTLVADFDRAHNYQHGGVSPSFREVMKTAAEESIETMKETYGPDCKDFDLFTWNFKEWRFNNKVRLTKSALRLNPNTTVTNYHRNDVLHLIQEMEDQPNYFWEHIRENPNYQEFNRGLFYRWVKLFFFAFFTFGIVYLGIYIFKLNYTESYKKQI